MRAVVTGGAGFIGGALKLLLEAEDVKVVSIDTRTGTAIQDVRQTPSADVIFHVASPVGPVGVLRWAGRLVPEVITTTSIVRGWALSNQCPLIYVSTSEIYGTGTAARESDACVFDAPTSARKEYAVAKLAAETMLRNSGGLDLRIVRPFNVAGPGQRGELGFVLPRFAHQLAVGRPLTVYAPGTQKRAFAHVIDIAEGLTAAWRNGAPGGIYNLGNPATLITIQHLAERVISIAGRGSYQVVDPTVEHGPSFREAPDKIPCIDKSRRDLEWEPRIGLNQIIEDVLTEHEVLK